MNSRNPGHIDLNGTTSGINVALLTAGRDKPYALGLAEALLDAKIGFDFLGSDEIDSPILHDNPLSVFRNMRGDQTENAPLQRKIVRVLSYYRRLLIYALRARPKIFHVLWNNKFELFDRTILMVFYRLCGRRLVLTAHNVNAGSRDGNDSFLNRLTLKIQYRLAHHVFVHTEQMRRELQNEFQVRPDKCSVIPFGMNSTVPDTSLDGSMARSRLGIGPHEKVLLFFGNIAAYKGLEYLVEAMAHLHKNGVSCRLLIAGRVKDSEAYWDGIRERISRLSLDDCILSRSQYIPDEETEIYFKAADVLILPYRHIFQSGVLFLAYNFGLPVIASDVGSLKEDIIEGKTGFVCRPENAESLAQTIQRYFESDLYRDLQSNRQEIRNFASERYSWRQVANITAEVYTRLLTSK